MFCSNDTDLNNYFKRQEANEKAYEDIRAHALEAMDNGDVDGGEVLWACEQFDLNNMTAEQVGKYIIEHRNAILERYINKML